MNSNNNFLHLPIFSNSIRVFFPLTALLAVLVPMWTVCVVVNGYPFKSTHFSLYEWHGFQMVFSYFYTLIMGFILTAGAHWTGQRPLAGKPIFILFALWFVDQIIILAPVPTLMLYLSSGLLSSYFMFLVFSLLKTYLMRYPFLGIFSLFSVARILFIYAASVNSFEFKDNLYEITLWALTLLTMIVGGRVTPRFTRNFFKIKQELLEPKFVKLGSFAFMVMAIISLKVENPYLIGSLYFGAGFLTLLRMMFWNSLQAIKKPIIGMLHVGMFVLSVSIMIKGLSFIIPDLQMTRAALHLVLSGGISIMALSIMIRASLGHTGRPIVADKGIYAIYFCVILGALIRFVVPVFFPSYFIVSLHNSMGFWTMAFLIYLFKYWPIMFKKRADAK